MSDLHLHFHISSVIGHECLPFFRRMYSEIPGAAFVCLGGLTGLAEVPNQVFAFGELLLLQPDGGTDILQGKWQARICRPDHGAVPPFRGEITGDNASVP